MDTARDLPDPAVIAERVRIYRDVLVAARTVRTTPVWPTEGGINAVPVDPTPELGRLSEAMHLTRLFSSARVITAVDHLCIEVANLVTTIGLIRRGSQPGHRGAIDLREQAGYDAASSKVDTAIDTFTAAARADLGIEATHT